MADLDGTILAYDYRAQLAYVMTLDHTHVHNFHSPHPQRVVRSVVKSWCMLDAHDSRKQKSYRLNRP